MSTENIYAAESVPPRSGMSGTTKLLLGAGAGCFLLVVLACGGFMFVSYQLAKNMMSNDPAVIRENTANIVGIDILAGLEPKFTMKIPMVVTMTQFGDKDNHDELVLVQLNENDANEAQFAQFQAQLDAQSGGKSQRARELEVETTKEHKVEIHGEEAIFTISTGKDKDGHEVRVVSGKFKGAGGAAMLYFLGDAEQHSEESLQAMLDSMK